MFCDLNLYKLDLDFDKVYKKKLFIEENDTIASLKQKAYQCDSILINNQEIISYKKIDDFCEAIDFTSLEEYFQIQLLQLFLRKEKRLFERLSYFLPNQNFNEYSLVKEIIGNVFKFDKFYLSLDIKQSIIPRYTLLEELKLRKYKNPKSELINKEVKPINKSSLGIIKKVIFPNDPEYKEELEMIIDYFKKQGIKINCYQKEPIIKVIFKKSKNNIAYSYLASHLKLYYSPQDVDIKMTIPNSRRKQIIENAIKESNLNYLSSQPYKKEFIKFYPVKFLGFKEVNELKYLLVKANRNIYTIYPKRIPHIFKNTNIIKTIILIDKTISTSKNSYINILFKGLKSIYEKTNIEFKLVNIRDYSLEFSTKNIVNKALEYKKKYELIPPLVITIGSKKNLSYYEDMKRLLFKYGFITQNIIYEHLLKSTYYEINNLILQILVKYGMYPYTIDINHPYDYIIGIDVGNDRYGNRNIAGGISIINREGILEKLIPIKVHTNGEKIDLSMFLEELSIHLDLKSKNILMLRDGKLTKNEKESILKEFDRLNIKSITFINVVKNHSLRIFDDNEGKKGVILKDNLALLLAHEIKGARAVKINVKSVIKNGIIKNEAITKNDLELLFNLTNLNYSNLYLFSKRLRLPAPIHYSDKFVKALGKGWKIKEDLLLNGFLYFI